MLAAMDARLIEEVRAAGAAISLIGDGDIAGIIQTCEPEETGIDIYLGMGGAPEGVLAAAALRCIGGQIQGRLAALNDQHMKRAEHFGIKDLNHKYSTADIRLRRYHLLGDRRNGWVAVERRQIL